MRLLLLFACAVLVVSSHRFTIFESTDKVPQTWRLVGRADRDASLKFSVALKARNMDVLERELMRASDPRLRESYGKWWTREQVEELISPELKEQMSVQNWLESHGMEVSRHGNFQRVTGSVGAIEEMLQTKFFSFQRVADGKMVYRLIDYTVPSHLEGTIQMISGLSGFPRQKPGPHVQTLDDTKGKIVPEVIWSLYDMPEQEVVFPNSSICLVEFENDRSYTDADLISFEEQCGLPSVNVSHIVGPYYPKFPDTEASLDVEYGIGVALESDVWYWTTTGWLYDFTTEFLATTPVPYVVSMSWGWTEVAQCDIGACNGMTSEEYTNTVNDQFMQITMQGVTLLASSGDQGAPGDGNAKCNNRETPLSSIFPGASPWVLSIGATMLTDSNPNDPYNYKTPICQTTDCATSKDEVACSYPDALITTGGGFSTFLPQPSYQTEVVSNYLKITNLPDEKDFNRTNRGFPDVSAVGHNFLTVIAGRNLLVDGTSASSPLWAGIITRWNNYRLSNGLPSIGFSNPMIYQMFQDQPSAFIDTTVGNNACTESCCVTGYNCEKGWDAATGLGTPNYPDMWNYIKNLP